MAQVLGRDAWTEVEPCVRKAMAGERCALEAPLSFGHRPRRHVAMEFVPHRVDDELRGFFAMMEDVTHRVEAERSRAWLAAIVENSHDAIVALNLDGTISAWNAAAERIYGSPAEEMLGRPFAGLLPANRRAEVDDVLEAVRAGERVERSETIHPPGGDPPIDVSVTISPIRNDAGELMGASLNARDITLQKRSERQLQELADRLEERVAERTAVAERSAENLRGLAAQVGRTEQRVRQRLAQTIHDDLQQMLVAAKMRVPTDAELASGEELGVLRNLLDEALERSRQLVNDVSPAVLNDGTLADALVWLAGQMRRQHSLDVAVEAPGESPPLPQDLKILVFEVVRELLFNVVKHAGAEAARVSLRRGEDRIELEVTDAGKGFDRGRAGSATGYGLASARRRVEAVGGAFDVDSAPGSGARVRLSLPVKSTEPERSTGRPVGDRPRPQGPPRPPAVPGVVRVLLADDHEIVREGLRRILAAEPGIEVVAEAADGEAAVEETMEQQPDVVVMDITMPRLNGIEATQEISARCPGTTVIGLSLHDEDALGKAIQEAGAVAYLQKDAASTGLIDAIREHCPPGTRAPSADGRGEGGLGEGDRERGSR